MKKIVLSTLVAVLVLTPALIFAEQPGFWGKLDGSGYIAQYPRIEHKGIIRIYSGEPYYTNPLSPLLSHDSRLERSSFDNNSLTFTGNYYRVGGHKYSYTSRTADAKAFYSYREKELLKKQLGQIRASALSKRQKDKAGGLLSLNIPIKSKAFEGIFGEGGAGLKVSGYHRINFSGRSQWTDQASTASIKQSKFPALNMEQVSRFEINGTIGSKITVSVSQDSKTTTPLANNLILRYKGDEDDILQTIEAGNTDLSLPNTRFAGYSQRIRGLFGVKTTAKLGGLSLTAIISQEKGNSERTSYEPGAGATMKTIRDYQYAYGRYFDLGRMARNHIDPNEFDFKFGDSIITIVVFKSSNSTGRDADLAAPPADFYVDPNDTTKYESEKGFTTVFQLESPVDYEIHPTEHYIVFNSPNGGSDGYLGYYMEVLVDALSGKIDTIGNMVDFENYKLKLLKSNSPQKSYVSWNYEWRNVYSLQAKNIDLEGLEINIFKGETGTEQSDDNDDHQNGIKYIRMLGLDRYDRKGDENPDDQVDVYSPIIDAYRGLLIFPDRKPFAPSNHYVASQPLELEMPGIYTLDYGHSDLTKQTLYYLQVTNLSRQAEISLNKPNIIENSERITLNGVDLVKGKDYSINYDFGRVTFMHPDATDANADITIDFEYTPFITSQQKSLLGVRAEYEFSKNLKLGATYLYKSDKATDRKPKVGQETSRAYVWDADISFKVAPQFLTSLVDALPFYKTEAKSNVQVSAEVAQSHPNPNIYGVAYIDDFEGSRDSYSLGILRKTWTISSRPLGLDSNYYRSRMIWYNPYDQVPTEQIWDRGEDRLRREDNSTHILQIRLTPHDSLITVVDEETSDTSYITPESWGGIMRSMSAGAINQDRAQLLEFRVRGTEGIIHIELGAISEDVNGNDSLDTEDLENQLSHIANGIYDKGEDIGLDGKDDQEEGGYDVLSNPDPAGDNWYYDGENDPNNYEHINGTQGNINDPARDGRPDTEDLDGDLAPDFINNYKSFKIDLSDTTFLVKGSEYPPDSIFSPKDQWRTYRIPIIDPEAEDVANSFYQDFEWTKIDYIRLWFESPNENTIWIGIATADIVQSNWEPEIRVDAQNANLIKQSKFTVAVINNQEHSGIYNSPSEVSSYVDPVYGTVEPEQSLMLKYENLNPGDTCFANRFLYDTPNYAGYRRLKMYVHAPDNADTSLQFFFRVGSTADDYYEYQTNSLVPGWIGNEVDIDFNEITGLKDKLFRLQVDYPDTNAIDSTYISGYTYRVVGEPSITRVKYLACGIVNNSERNQIAELPSGEIWVNELRLIDVRRDVGNAARIAVSGNMADLFTYRANYYYQDSYFRKLSSSTKGGSGSNLGSGKRSTTLSGGLSFDISKLLPRSFSASMPVSITYSKKTIVPRLLTNSDIVLPQQSLDKESTISESKGFSVSESFSKKTRNPLFTLILNPLKTSFSYSKVVGRSPRRPSSYTETYHIKGSYSFRIKKVPGISPFFWTSPVPLLKKLSGTKFYLLPTSFSSSGDFNRNLSISENSGGVFSTSFKRDFGGNMRLDYKVSNNLTTNFNMNTKRDLNDPDLVRITWNPKKFRFGRETSYGQSFGATYQLSLVAFLTHSFNYSVDYRETINVRDSTRDARSTKSYGISGSFDHQRLFGLGIVKKDQPRSQRKRRSNRSNNKTDSTEVVKKKKNIKSRFLGPVSNVLTFLTSWLNPIGYDFNERFSYSYGGLTERAKLAFRFGFTSDIGSPIRSTTSSLTTSTAVSKLTSYSFRTGTRFLGGLKTDVGFIRKVNQDIIKSSNRNKSISTTFPDLRFTIRKLKVFTFFNPIISRFNPRTGFTRSVDKSYNLQTGHQSSERTTVGQRPLLALTANVLGGVQLTFSTDRTVTEDKTINSQNGEISNKRRTILSNTSFSVKYSFNSPRGIKIPILGRLKFKSNLSLSTDVSFRSQKKESAARGGSYVSTGEETNFVVTPSISYSFSSQMNGGLTGKWQTTNNVAQNRKSSVRELRIWVEFRF